MDRELRSKALACIDEHIQEIQVIIIVYTRGLAYKVSEQLNEDSGKRKCLPCINDRRIEATLTEFFQHNYSIIAGTLGRIDMLFYRNLLKSQHIKEIYILDATAILYSPLKRPLERVLGFMNANIRIILQVLPGDPVMYQLQDYFKDISCYGTHPDLIQANHFALYVPDEIRKMDTLCDLCNTHTSVPILICCSGYSRKALYTTAKVLRAHNLPVLTLTKDLKAEDTRIAMEAFLSGEVRIMITSGYIRGLMDLKIPMIIINYDLPKPDAYARRINFTDESWIAKRTVFITLVKMHEREKLCSLKEKLRLRWILEMSSN